MHLNFYGDTNNKVKSTNYNIIQVVVRKSDT